MESKVVGVFTFIFTFTYPWIDAIETNRHSTRNPFSFSHFSLSLCPFVRAISVRSLRFFIKNGKWSKQNKVFYYEIVVILYEISGSVYVILRACVPAAVF